MKLEVVLQQQWYSSTRVVLAVASTRVVLAVAGCSDTGGFIFYNTIRSRRLLRVPVPG